MSAERPGLPGSASVRYAAADGIAEIVLDHPPANALTESMVAALVASLDRAAADDAVRVVLVRSAVPRRFCAGLDVGALDGAPPERIRTLLETLYRGLHDAQRRLGKPSIALVEGAARGGGMTLAVSCDLIVASESASFGYPEIDVGLMPGIHFALLPRIVGRHRAFELLFGGAPFDAQRAHELGLVNRVAADGDAVGAARELAVMLAGKSPTAMRAGREAFHRALDLGLSDGIDSAIEAFCELAATPEAKAQVAAFGRNRRAAGRDDAGGSRET